jgi:hypothetical protein
MNRLILPLVAALCCPVYAQTRGSALDRPGPSSRLGGEAVSASQETVRATVAEVAANSFTLKGRAVELVGYRRPEFHEVSAGVYQIEFRESGKGIIVEATAEQAEWISSRYPGRLFVTVIDGSKYGSGIKAKLLGNDVRNVGTIINPKAEVFWNLRR